MDRRRLHPLRGELITLMTTIERAIGAIITQSPAQRADAERKRERYATDPDHREKKKAKAADYRAKNPEKQAKYAEKWRKKGQHAEVQRRYRMRRKANERP